MRLHGKILLTRMTLSVVDRTAAGVPVATSRYHNLGNLPRNRFIAEPC